MLGASDYDRFYRVLGLEPGGSLSEIETQWKLCCAAVHPDKFAAHAKAQATSRIQEINNAHDELRRYWRRHGGPPPTRSGNGPRVTTIRLPDDPAARDAQPPDEGWADHAADAEQFAPTADRAGPKQWHRVPIFAAAAVALVGAVALAVVGLTQRDTSTAGYAPPAAVKMAVQSARPLEPPRSVAPVVQASGPTGQPSAPVRLQSAAPTLLESLAPIAPLVPEPSGVAQLVLSPAQIASLAPAMPANPWLSIVDGAPIGAPSSVGPGRPSAPKSSRVAAASSPGAPSPAEPSAAPLQPQRATSHAGQEEMRQAAIEACRNDLRKLCAGVQVGGGRIAQCVREHFQQLSSGCSGALLALRSSHPGGGAGAER